MKIVIIIVHILLGLFIIFININTQVLRYNQIHNPSTIWSSEDLSNSGVTNFIEDLKRSELQNTIEVILWVILGLFSIIGSIAFKKDKRWAVFTLPLITLLLVITLFYQARLVGGLAAGAYVLPFLVLLVFLISEILYITLKKRTQPVNF